MKKILIVDKSFTVGGIQTALINMVKELKDTYQIDVLMFYNKGLLKDRFPKEVKVITPSFLVRLHGMTLADAKSEGKLTYILRWLTGAFDKCFTNRFSIWFALLFQKKLRGYDVAVAFHHEDRPKATVTGFYRFVQKKTDAPVKLGWVHYDPENISPVHKKNLKYMKKMDKIVCVSESVAGKILSMYPALQGKTEYCYNFHDIPRILSLSQEPTDVSMRKDSFRCFTACRMVPVKAIPRAIRAFTPVLREHPDVVWYIAGGGPEEAECRKLIEEAGLEEQIILLGPKGNPYAYMAQADLYLQTSLNEAAPMVYGEAMICRLPVFTTDTLSARELVPEDSGFVCQNNPEAMAAMLQSLLQDREKVYACKKRMESRPFTNGLSREKLAALFEVTGK